MLLFSCLSAHTAHVLLFLVSTRFNPNDNIENAYVTPLKPRRSRGAELSFVEPDKKNSNKPEKNTLKLKPYQMEFNQLRKQRTLPIQLISSQTALSTLVEYYNIKFTQRDGVEQLCLPLTEGDCYFENLQVLRENLCAFGLPPMVKGAATNAEKERVEKLEYWIRCAYITGLRKPGAVVPQEVNMKSKVARKILKGLGYSRCYLSSLYILPGKSSIDYDDFGNLLDLFNHIAKFGLVDCRHSFSDDDMLKFQILVVSGATYDVSKRRTDETYAPIINACRSDVCSSIIPMIDSSGAKHPPLNNKSKPELKLCDGPCAQQKAENEFGSSKWKLPGFGTVPKNEWGEMAAPSTKRRLCLACLIEETERRLAEMKEKDFSLKMNQIAVVIPNEVSFAIVVSAGRLGLTFAMTTKNDLGAHGAKILSVGTDCTFQDKVSPGDTIVSIDGKKVESLEDVKAGSSRERVLHIVTRKGIEPGKAKSKSNTRNYQEQEKKWLRREQMVKNLLEMDEKDLNLVLFRMAKEKSETYKKAFDIATGIPLSKPVELPPDFISYDGTNDIKWNTKYHELVAVRILRMINLFIFQQHTFGQTLKILQ